MPIIVNLDKILRERGMTARELSERIGITEANLSILRSGKARAIRFETLESLCFHLRCTPGDILKFAEGEEKDE